MYVSYTSAHVQARARAHTHRQTHTQMPHRRSPSPTRTLSLFAARSRCGRPSTCLDDRVREAAKWLQAAFDGGHVLHMALAKLHLAHLTFEAGQEDVALAHLKWHLSWRVLRGRDTCAGCEQTRGEDAPMLTCSDCGCRVARFCSADHQKMAWPHGQTESGGVVCAVICWARAPRGGVT